MFGEHQNNLDFTVFITLKEMEDVTILNTESLQTAGKIDLYFNSCKKRNCSKHGVQFFYSGVRLLDRRLLTSPCVIRTKRPSRRHPHLIS